MALLVSASQAACNALARWLVTKLVGVVDAASIYDRWPEPTVPLWDKDAANKKAVTILYAGSPTDQMFDPVVLSSTPVDATHDTFLWRFRCRSQPIQLDLWSSTNVERDDLEARIEKALNASDPSLNPNFDPVVNGLMLPMADGLTGVADFLFEGPDRIDTPDSNQRSEFRSIYRGHVDVMLTQTAVSAHIALITLKQHARLTTAIPAHLPTDVASVSDTTETYTVIP